MRTIFAGSGAADDGVVDEDDAFSCDEATIGFNFSLTPKLRMACDGSMKVRPM